MVRTTIESLNGHRGGVVWFTGLPGSGKTTIATETQKILLQKGIRCAVIDGDRLRKGMNRDLGYAEEDRFENHRRAAEAARLLVDAGCVVLVSMISPSAQIREMARSCFDPGDYFELYVKCSLEECVRRDPKGMYRLAQRGVIPQFTGISAPYEPPSQPGLALDTEKRDVEECVRLIVRKLVQNIIINNREDYVI